MSSALAGYTHPRSPALACPSHPSRPASPTPPPHPRPAQPRPQRLAVRTTFVLVITLLAVVAPFVMCGPLRREPGLPGGTAPHAP